MRLHRSTYRSATNRHHCDLFAFRKIVVEGGRGVVEEIFLGASPELNENFLLEPERKEKEKKKIEKANRKCDVHT